MLALYTSDLHGEPRLYQQLWDLVEARRPDLVILGGDICPTHFGPEGPPLQRRFLEGLLRRFDHYAPLGVRFLFIFGNADCRANWDWLCSMERPHAIPLHNRVVELGDGLSFLGYSFVPVTPLRLKDWEKRDRKETGSEQWEGIRTREGGVDKVDLRNDTPDESLEADLARMAALAGHLRPICVMHSPPSDTRLDCIPPDRHVGSHAARDFLLKLQPPLALHGHIHESPELSGHFADHLRGTLCVNPGQNLGGDLHAVFFDPENAHDTITHTVLGPHKPQK